MLEKVLWIFKICEQQESYKIAKNFYIYKKRVEYIHAKDKKYHKVRDNCHFTGKYTGAEMLHIAYLI